MWVALSNMPGLVRWFLVTRTQMAHKCVSVSYGNRRIVLMVVMEENLVTAISGRGATSHGPV